MDKSKQVTSESGLIVAIHQPNFIPWPGYFHKMLMANVFIYLDNVPFSKNSFQNRNKLLINNESKWLTVPVLTRGKYTALTNDVQINNQSKWKKKHLATIEQNYCRCPCFSWVFESLKLIYAKDHETLVSFSVEINEEIRKMLNIVTPIRFASELLFTEGATDRLVKLTNAVGGDVYISGNGGKKYLDEKQFVNAGIKLMYQNFVYRPYSQNRSEFIPYLSVLDLLFNLGQNASAWLRGETYGEN